MGTAGKEKSVLISTFASCVEEGIQHHNVLRTKVEVLTQISTGGQPKQMLVIQYGIW